MESVHESGKGSVIFTEALLARMERGIDKGVESEQSPPDFLAKTRCARPIEQFVLLLRMRRRTIKKTAAV
jgi:hypothetical protein